ncbi:MAG: hypothetical protein U9N54_08080 [candidate division Zixibacteria bacterium]|nr:hypothetical protein [candidate division Zixibacteria bacterium]
MKCNEVKNELMLITDDKELTSSLREHLLRCADCKKYYEEMQNLLEDFGSDDLFSPTDSETDAMIKNINNEITKKKPTIIPLHRYLSIAAALILVLGVTYIARKTGEFDKYKQPIYANSDSINRAENNSNLLNDDYEMYGNYFEQLNLENYETDEEFLYYLSDEDFEYLEDNFDVKELLL